MTEKFYGDPVIKFRAMAKGDGEIDIAHFRMWCNIAADEIERLRAAITPSGETKAAYIGEITFPVDCIDDAEESYMNVQLPWTSMKDFMAIIRKHAGV